MANWIDTNVLLRFREGVPGAVRFVETLQYGGRMKYYILAVVLEETEWVLRSVYKQEKKMILMFINALVLLPGIKVVYKYNIGKALDLYQENNVKFMDCVIASAMAKDETIVSYDADFDKLSTIKRIEPKDLFEKQ